MDSADTATGFPVRRRFGIHPLVVAAAAVIVVVGVAGLAWVTLGGGPGPGPLALPPNGWSMSGGPALPRQWAVTAISTATLGGSAPAVLESVSPTYPTQARGVETRFAVIVGGGIPGFLRGWPPPGQHDQLASVSGYVVKPGASVNLAVGVASRHPGRWRISSFSIRYRVGSQQYTATFAQGIEVNVLRHCRACARYARRS